MSRRASRLVAAIASACVTLSVSANAQQPTLRAVLDRLHAYLSEYAVRLPATIATERYDQECRGTPHTLLESEFGIMRMESPAGWLGIRDVLSVNGRAVAGREDRLQSLVRIAPAQRLEQARRIAQENARFNVGPIQRTINDPAVVLAFLDSNAAHMRFSKMGEATIEGGDTWIVRFDERERPTFIKTMEGRDQPAKGRAWIDPRTGRLMRAELTIDSPPERFGPVNHLGFTATIVVEFKDEPRLGMWVPSRMTERYASLLDPCSGDATYSNYRTFGVETKILSP